MLRHYSLALLHASQGGLKLLPRVLRSYTADAMVLAVCGRVLIRCVSGSAVNQQALAKERVRRRSQVLSARRDAASDEARCVLGRAPRAQGLAQALLSALTAHCRDASVVPPLMELVVLLSRTPRGAQTLGVEGMVTLAKDLLVNFMVRRGGPTLLSERRAGPGPMWAVQGAWEGGRQQSAAGAPVRACGVRACHCV